MVEEWRKMDFAEHEIDTAEIANTAEEYSVKVSKVQKRMPMSPAVKALAREVSDFRETMPIVSALGSKYL
jgi:hypothetical protein